MADSLQPDLPSRSAMAEAALSNKNGIVLPPDNVEDATSAMDSLFENELGRAPTTLDNIADRDRDKLTDRQIDTAEEMPEQEEQVTEEVVTSEMASNDKPETPEETVQPEAPAQDEPQPDDLLTKLLGKEEKVETAPEAPSEEDPYDKVKLRSDASEKTKNTFEELKRTAKDRELKARTEAEQARKELQELRAKMDELSKKTVPDNLEAELKELREFRATFDAERDPEFQQKFSSRLEQNNGTIFETLKRNGLKDDLVEQVKAMPYDQQVEQIARWAEKLSPRDKLLITARLADNENIESDRQSALRDIKSKADQILAEKRNAPARSQDQFVEEAVRTLKPVLPQIPFLHPKEAPANATPATKAEIEKHNALAAESQKMLLTFLQDDSARTRSVLALAGILAPRYQAQLKEAEGRVKALEKELSSIREAGRLSKTTRSSATAERAAPRVDVFDTNAEDAMEEAWKAMQR
jgi:hypothetical protein